MMLQPLKLIKGANPRVGVVEVNNEANNHLIVFSMVEEETTAGTVCQWPSATVDNQTLLVTLGLYIPELFDTQPVVLRIFTSRQIELTNQLFTQMTATALTEQREFGLQRHAWDIGIFLFAALTHAHRASQHTFYPPRLVVEYLSRRKSGEHLNTELFRLFS